jgi:hypothetical protein
MMVSLRDGKGNIRQEFLDENGKFDKKQAEKLANLTQEEGTQKGEMVLSNEDLDVAQANYYEKNKKK